VADSPVRRTTSFAFDIAGESVFLEARSSFTAAERQQNEQGARAALRTSRAGSFPFNEPSRDWRRDPGWDRPVLPDHAKWQFDQLIP
jgi:hypothetical protein